MRHEDPEEFEMNRFLLSCGSHHANRLGHLATPLIAEEGNQAFRSIAEEQTKDEVDQAVSKFRKAAQEKDSHVLTKNLTTWSG